MTTIDLNSDLGEGFGAWAMGDDAAMLDVVSSANVACGFHAGDPTIMLATARAAADRAYEPDGSLVSRKQPGSVLHDPDEVAARVLRMVADGVATAVDGSEIAVCADSVCVHGDSPDAVAMARAIRALLTEHGVTIAPFAP